MSRLPRHERTHAMRPYTMVASWAIGLFIVSRRTTYCERDTCKPENWILVSQSTDTCTPIGFEPCEWPGVESGLAGFRLLLMRMVGRFTAGAPPFGWVAERPMPRESPPL